MLEQGICQLFNHFVISKTIFQVYEQYKGAVFKVITLFILRIAIDY